MPLPVASVTDELPEHRAKVAYWRAEYRDLTAAAPLSGGNTKKENIEPSVMLVAANAAFRSSLSEAGDRNATVERLDRVIQAYADVLRADPNNLDASYTLRVVARFRDGSPRPKGGKIRRNNRDGPTASSTPASTSRSGRRCTAGRGGPPQDLPMQQFRTVPRRCVRRARGARTGSRAKTRRRG